MNPWDINSAAGKLVGQARTLGTRHLAYGRAREQFNREVAFYAMRIADDVGRGHKTPEQGLQALVQEQRDLLIQSQALTGKAPAAITEPIKDCRYQGSHSPFQNLTPFVYCATSMRKISSRLP